MLFFWFCACVVISIFANKKGRNWFGWFFLSLIISPLIAGVILALIKDLTIQDDITHVNRKIEATLSEVKYKQKINDYNFDTIQNQLGNVQKQISNPYLSGNTDNKNQLEDKIIIKCKNCGTTIKNDVKFCPECGNAIIKLEENLTEYEQRDRKTEKKFICPECFQFNYPEKKTDTSVKCNRCGKEYNLS